MWRNTVFQKKIIAHTIKHGGGSVMVLAGLSALGPGLLAVTD